MRKFKFRAWAFHTKSMLNMDELLSDGVLKFCLKHKDTFQIMQNTGLKDKNGKEIYEGDIIEYEDIIDGYGNTVVKKEVIEFDNTNGGLNISYRITEGLMFVYNFNVIGNIYENPDLLNK